MFIVLSHFFHYKHTVRTHPGISERRGMKHRPHWLPSFLWSLHTHQDLLLFLMTHRKFHIQLLTLKDFLERAARYSAPVTQKEIESFSTRTNSSPSVDLNSSPAPFIAAPHSKKTKEKSVSLVLFRIKGSLRVAMGQKFCVEVRK